MASEKKLLSRLRRELATEKLEPLGGGGGGCISRGQGYGTDQGQVFVKQNMKEGVSIPNEGHIIQARLMFDGEAASLKAISETHTVRVPKPIKVFDSVEGDGDAVLVMEYLEMRSLTRHSAALGEQLARLHLHNDITRRKAETQESYVHRGEALTYVDKFGFDVTTCCGFIPQDNTWESEWPTFFARRKLAFQLDLIEKEFADREARSLWSELQLKLPSFFKDVEMRPALLHGDLWGGNAAETDSGPVIFDAASFYGHSEYDLAIAQMFGGFSQKFFDSYHKLIPKAQNYQQRNKLYQLFHYLNHWNHFGSGYRSQSLSLMRDLLRQ